MERCSTPKSVADCQRALPTGRQYGSSEQLGLRLLRVTCFVKGKAEFTEWQSTRISRTATRYVYVFMASNLNDQSAHQRVVRLTLSADNTSASGRTDIITDIAYKDVGNGVGGAGAHSGGRIALWSRSFPVCHNRRQP